jgi:hypothetical protein
MGQDPYNNDFRSPDYERNAYYNPTPQAQNPYSNADAFRADPYNHDAAYRSGEGRSPYERDRNPYGGEVIGEEHNRAYAYGQFQQGANATPVITGPTRNTSTIALSILLYLWATLCGFLGVTGFVQGVAPTIADDVLGIILLAQILLSLVVMVIVLIKHKRPHIRWWMRLLFTLGASVLGLIAAVIAVGVSDPANLGTYRNPFENYVLGSVFLVYYIVMAVVALY